MREALANQKAYTLHLVQELKTGNMSFDELIETVPSILHLNDAQTFEIVGASPSCIIHTQYPVEEIGEVGQQGYLEYIMAKEDRERVSLGLTQYLTKGDFRKPISFIQRVRGKTNPLKPFLTTTAVLPEQGVFFSYSVLASDAEAKRLKEGFHSDVQRYCAKHIWSFQRLSQSELDILTLFAIGNKYRTIADQMHISLETVKTHLKSIRRKTGLNTIQELVKYALAFQLIQY